jgi:hypothetical protein
MASWNPDGIIQSMNNKPEENKKTEPFIEGNVNYTYDGTKPLDFNLSEGRNFNEQVLSIINIASSEVVNITDTTKKETVDEIAKTSYMDQLEEIRKKGDLQKFRKLIGNLIKSIPDSIEKQTNAIADLIVAFYYTNIESAEAKVARKVIIDQINLYLIIPVSFWVALNWWYVWNYTNFTFNFMDFLKYPPFNMMYYVVEPGFYVLEMMNYYMLTIRMDKDLACWKRAILTTLWDWRPVTFTIFALVTAGLLQSMPVSETAGGMVGGDSTAVSGLIFIGTIIAFAYLTLTCMARMLRFNSLLQNAFLLAFTMLLFFLFVIIVAGFAAGVAVFYYLFFSQMVLICFELLNCDAKVQEMLNDLRTAPVNDPDAKLSEKPFTFLKQYCFRNFFGLCWVFCAVIPVFVYSMIQISTISNLPMMITLIIFVVLLDIAMLYPAIDILQKLTDYINKMMEDKSIEIKEEPIVDPVPPPLKPMDTGKGDESRSLLNDILLFMMNPLKSM